MIAIVGSTISCGSYKQNLMFQPEESFKSAEISPDAIKMVQDYQIQKNDYLNIEVFSNNGEKIIDPNPELSNANAVPLEKEKVKYLVTTDGTVKLPMVEEIELQGLTLRDAEIKIQDAYSKFFKDPYVVMNFENKRAILLGASGGQVIPLVNQNMKLTEVLALGKGLDNNAKAHNIRVLRGDDVFIIDLSTIEGYRVGNMLIQPGDIIYIEPIRRPFSEALRENGTLLSIIVSLASFVVIILRF